MTASAVRCIHCARVLQGASALEAVPIHSYCLTRLCVAALAEQDRGGWRYVPFYGWTYEPKEHVK